MVRETRYLIVRNLPENCTEQAVIEHFQRYGKIQSVKLQQQTSKDNESSTSSSTTTTTTATVAFNDIKSAAKAHHAKNSLGDSTLRTDYWEGSTSTPVLASNPPPSSTATAGSSSGGRPAGSSGSGGPASSSRPGTGSFSNWTKGSGDDDSTDKGDSTTSTAIASVAASSLDQRSRPRERFSKKKFGQKFEKTGSFGHYGTTTSSRSLEAARSQSEAGGAASSNPSNSTGANTGLNPIIVSDTKDVKDGKDSSKSRGTYSPGGSRHGMKKSNSQSRSASRSQSRGSRSSSSHSDTSGSSPSTSPHRSHGGMSTRPQSMVGASRLQSSEASKRDMDDGEKRPLGICVGGLPVRSTDSSLRDGLYHEYKKHGKVTQVQVFGDGEDRYAVVSFRKPEDACKALEASQGKTFFGAKIKVTTHEGVEVDDPERLNDNDSMDEYFIKSTRTLFVGNLEKETTKQDLVDKFKHFGKIIDVDIKRQGATTAYAFVQYVDITSVVKALRDMEGEHIGINKIKLGFGKSMLTYCVWLDCIPLDATSRCLKSAMQRYGEVAYCFVDRDRSKGLVYFTNSDDAQRCVSDIKIRPHFMKKKLQVDFASRECQLDFLDRMEESGQLRPSERPDVDARGPGFRQQRSFDSFQDDGSPTGFNYSSRSQSFSRNGRSGSSSNNIRGGSRQYGENNFPDDGYAARRTRRAEDFGQAGTYYSNKGGEDYDQVLREYGHSQRERRERDSSPRRSLDHSSRRGSRDRSLDRRVDTQSRRSSRERSLDRYDSRSRDRGVDVYNSRDLSPGSDHNSYRAESRYRSVREDKYSVRDRYEDGKGDDKEFGQLSHAASPLYHNNSLHGSRSHSPASSPQEDPSMYRMFYLEDYKRQVIDDDYDNYSSSKRRDTEESIKSRSSRPPIFTKLGAEVAKTVEKSRKRTHEESGLSSNCKLKLLRKLEKSSLSEKEKLRHLSRLSSKNTLKDLERMPGSPGSSGSRGDSENGSMGMEGDLQHLHQEKQQLLLELQELQEEGTQVTSDSESPHSHSAKMLALAACLSKHESGKSDHLPASYRSQLEKLREPEGGQAGQNHLTEEMRATREDKSPSGDREEEGNSDSDFDSDYRRTKKRRIDGSDSGNYVHKDIGDGSEEDDVINKNYNSSKQGHRASRRDSKGSSGGVRSYHVNSSSCDNDYFNKHPLSDKDVSVIEEKQRTSNHLSGKDWSNRLSPEMCLSPALSEEHTHDSVTSGSFTEKSSKYLSPLPWQHSPGHKDLASDGEFCFKEDSYAVSPCLPDDALSDDSLGEPPQVPGEPSLEERIRAIDEAMNRTVSSKSNDPSHFSSLVGKDIVNNNDNMSDLYSKFRIRKREKTEPSVIMQQVLSKKSILDQDFKRLEQTNKPESQKGVVTPSAPLVVKTEPVVEVKDEKDWSPQQQQQQPVTTSSSMLQPTVTSTLAGVTTCLINTSVYTAPLVSAALTTAKTEVSSTNTSLSVKEMVLNTSCPSVSVSSSSSSALSSSTTCVTAVSSPCSTKVSLVPSSFTKTTSSTIKSPFSSLSLPPSVLAQHSSSNSSSAAAPLSSSSSLSSVAMCKSPRSNTCVCTASLSSIPSQSSVSSAPLQSSTSSTTNLHESPVATPFTQGAGRIPNAQQMPTVGQEAPHLCSPSSLPENSRTGAPHLPGGATVHAVSSSGSVITDSSKTINVPPHCESHTGTSSSVLKDSLLENLSDQVSKSTPGVNVTEKVDKDKDDAKVVPKTDQLPSKGVDACLQTGRNVFSMDLSQSSTDSKDIVKESAKSSTIIELTSDNVSQADPESDKSLKLGPDSLSTSKKMHVISPGVTTQTVLSVTNRDSKDSPIAGDVPGEEKGVNKATSVLSAEPDSSKGSLSMGNSSSSSSSTSASSSKADKKSSSSSTKSSSSSSLLSSKLSSSSKLEPLFAPDPKAESSSKPAARDSSQDSKHKTTSSSGSSKNFSSSHNIQKSPKPSSKDQSEKKDHADRKDHTEKKDFDKSEKKPEAGSHKGKDGDKNKVKRDQSRDGEKAKQKEKDETKKREEKKGEKKEKPVNTREDRNDHVREEKKFEKSSDVKKDKQSICKDKSKDCKTSGSSIKHGKSEDDLAKKEKKSKEKKDGCKDKKLLSGLSCMTKHSTPEPGSKSSKNTNDVKDSKASKLDHKDSTASNSRSERDSKLEKDASHGKAEAKSEKDVSVKPEGSSKHNESVTAKIEHKHPSSKSDVKHKSDIKSTKSLDGKQEHLTKKPESSGKPKNKESDKDTGKSGNTSKYSEKQVKKQKEEDRQKEKQRQREEKEKQKEKEEKERKEKEEKERQREMKEREEKERREKAERERKEQEEKERIRKEKEKKEQEEKDRLLKEKDRLLKEKEERERQKEKERDEKDRKEREREERDRKERDDKEKTKREKEEREKQKQKDKEEKELQKEREKQEKEKEKLEKEKVEREKREREEKEKQKEKERKEKERKEKERKEKERKEKERKEKERKEKERKEKKEREEKAKKEKEKEEKSKKEKKEREKERESDEKEEKKKPPPKKAKRNELAALLDSNDAFQMTFTSMYDRVKTQRHRENETPTKSDAPTKSSFDKFNQNRKSKGSKAKSSLYSFDSTSDLSDDNISDISESESSVKAEPVKQPKKKPSKPTKKRPRVSSSSLSSSSSCEDDDDALLRASKTKGKKVDKFSAIYASSESEMDTGLPTKSKSAKAGKSKPAPVKKRKTRDDSLDSVTSREDFAKPPALSSISEPDSLDDDLDLSDDDAPKVKKKKMTKTKEKEKRDSSHDSVKKLVKKEKDLSDSVAKKSKSDKEEKNTPKKESKKVQDDVEKQRETSKVEEKKKKIDKDKKDKNNDESEKEKETKVEESTEKEDKKKKKEDPVKKKKKKKYDPKEEEELVNSLITKVYDKLSDKDKKHKKKKTTIFDSESDDFCSSETGLDASVGSAQEEKLFKHNKTEKDSKAKSKDTREQIKESESFSKIHEHKSKDANRKDNEKKDHVDKKETEKKSLKKEPEKKEIVAKKEKELLEKKEKEAERKEKELRKEKEAERKEKELKKEKEAERKEKELKKEQEHIEKKEVVKKESVDNKKDKNEPKIDNDLKHEISDSDNSLTKPPKKKKKKKDQDKESEKEEIGKNKKTLEKKVNSSQEKEDDQDKTPGSEKVVDEFISFWGHPKPILIPKRLKDSKKNEEEKVKTTKDEPDKVEIKSETDSKGKEEIKKPDSTKSDKTIDSVKSELESEDTVIPISEAETTVVTEILPPQSSGSVSSQAESVVPSEDVEEVTVVETTIGSSVEVNDDDDYPSLIIDELSDQGTEKKTTKKEKKLTKKQLEKERNDRIDKIIAHVAAAESSDDENALKPSPVNVTIDSVSNDQELLLSDVINQQLKYENKPSNESSSSETSTPFDKDKKSERKKESKPFFSLIGQSNQDKKDPLKSFGVVDEETKKRDEELLKTLAALCDPNTDKPVVIEEKKKETEEERKMKEEEEKRKAEELKRKAEEEEKARKEKEEQALRDASDEAARAVESLLVFQSGFEQDSMDMDDDLPPLFIEPAEKEPPTAASPGKDKVDSIPGTPMEEDIPLKVSTTLEDKMLHKEDLDKLDPSTKEFFSSPTTVPQQTTSGKSDPFALFTSPPHGPSTGPARRNSTTMSKDKTPEPIHLQSPQRHLSNQSPQQTLQSPQMAMQSPQRQVPQSPQAKTMASPQRLQSPQRQISQSPQRQMQQSPQRQIQSPQRQMPQSPLHQAGGPRGMMSPQVTHPSPQAHTQSPQKSPFFHKDRGFLSPNRDVPMAEPDVPSNVQSQPQRRASFGLPHHQSEMPQDPLHLQARRKSQDFPGEQNFTSPRRNTIATPEEATSIANLDRPGPVPIQGVRQRSHSSLPPPVSISLDNAIQEKNFQSPVGNQSVSPPHESVLLSPKKLSPGFTFRDQSHEGSPHFPNKGHLQDALFHSHKESHQQGQMFSHHISRLANKPLTPEQLLGASKVSLQDKMTKNIGEPPSFQKGLLPEKQVIHIGQAAPDPVFHPPKQDLPYGFNKAGQPSEAQFTVPKTQHSPMFSPPRGNQVHGEHFRGKDTPPAVGKEHVFSPKGPLQQGGHDNSGSYPPDQPIDFLLHSPPRNSHGGFFNYPPPVSEIKQPSVSKASDDTFNNDPLFRVLNESPRQQDREAPAPRRGFPASFYQEPVPSKPFQDNLNQQQQLIIDEDKKSSRKRKRSNKKTAKDRASALAEQAIQESVQANVESIHKALTESQARAAAEKAGSGMDKKKSMDAYDFDAQAGQEPLSLPNLPGSEVPASVFDTESRPTRRSTERGRGRGVARRGRRGRGGNAMVDSRSEPFHLQPNQALPPGVPDNNRGRFPAQAPYSMGMPPHSMAQPSGQPAATGNQGPSQTMPMFYQQSGQHPPVPDEEVRMSSDWPPKHPEQQAPPQQQYTPPESEHDQINSKGPPSSKSDVLSPDGKMDLDSSYGEPELVINLDEGPASMEGKENQYTMGSDTDDRPVPSPATSTKSQRSTRTRKFTDYRAIASGNVQAPLQSRPSRSVGSPRGRGGQSPKSGTSPRTRSSDSSSSSPVVKLEKLEYDRGSRRGRGNKKENDDEPGQNASFEDWKANKLGAEINKSRENIYEFDDTEQEQKVQPTSLRATRGRKKKLSENVTSDGQDFPSSPSSSTSSSLMTDSKIDSVSSRSETTATELGSMEEDTKTSSSHSNVDAIIDAVSKGHFGNNEDEVAPEEAFPDTGPTLTRSARRSLDAKKDVTEKTEKSVPSTESTRMETRNRKGPTVPPLRLKKEEKHYVIEHHGDKSLAVTFKLTDSGTASIKPSGGTEKGDAKPGEKHSSDQEVGLFSGLPQDAGKEGPGVNSQPWKSSEDVKPGEKTRSPSPALGKGGKSPGSHPASVPPVPALVQTSQHPSLAASSISTFSKTSTPQGLKQVWTAQHQEAQRQQQNASPATAPPQLPSPALPYERPASAHGDGKMPPSAHSQPGLRGNKGGKHGAMEMISDIPGKLEAQKNHGSFGFVPPAHTGQRPPFLVPGPQGSHPMGYPRPTKSPSVGLHKPDVVGGASSARTPPVTSAGMLYAGVVSGQPRSLSPTSASPEGQVIERLPNPMRQGEPGPSSSPFRMGVPHHQDASRYLKEELARGGEGPPAPHEDLVFQQLVEQRRLQQHLLMVMENNQRTEAARSEAGRNADIVHNMAAVHNALRGAHDPARSTPVGHDRKGGIPSSQAHNQPLPLNLSEADRGTPKSTPPQSPFPPSFLDRGKTGSAFMQPIASPGGHREGLPPHLYPPELSIPGLGPAPFGMVPRLPYDQRSIYSPGQQPPPHILAAPHFAQFPPGRYSAALEDKKDHDPGALHRSPSSSPGLSRQLQAADVMRQQARMPLAARESPVGILQHYPVMWQGALALKNDNSYVQMHFIAGNRRLPNQALPQPMPNGALPPLRISQRMRLEQAQLEGVAKRMQCEDDYCILVAVACGRDQVDINQQTRALSEGFITYLLSKQAAGIVNVPLPGSEQAGFVVHIFPPCMFVDNSVAQQGGVALMEQLREVPHAVIIIATT